MNWERPTPENVGRMIVGVDYGQEERQVDYRQMAEFALEGLLGMHGAEAAEQTILGWAAWLERVGATDAQQARELVDATLRARITGLVDTEIQVIRQRQKVG